MSLASIVDLASIVSLASTEDLASMVDVVGVIAVVAVRGWRPRPLASSPANSAATFTNLNTIFRL